MAQEQIEKPYSGYNFETNVLISQNSVSILDGQYEWNDGAYQTLNLSTINYYHIDTQNKQHLNQEIYFEDLHQKIQNQSQHLDKVSNLSYQNINQAVQKRQKSSNTHSNTTQLNQQNNQIQVNELSKNIQNFQSQVIQLQRTDNHYEQNQIEDQSNSVCQDIEIIHKNIQSFDIEEQNSLELVFQEPQKQNIDQFYGSTFFSNSNINNYNNDMKYNQSFNENQTYQNSFCAQNTVYKRDKISKIDNFQQRNSKTQNISNLFVESEIQLKNNNSSFIGNKSSLRLDSSFLKNFSNMNLTPFNEYQNQQTKANNLCLQSFEQTMNNQYVQVGVVNIENDFEEQNQFQQTQSDQYSFINLGDQQTNQNIQIDQKESNSNFGYIDASQNQNYSSNSFYTHQNTHFASTEQNALQIIQMPSQNQNNSEKQYKTEKVQCLQNLSQNYSQNVKEPFELRQSDLFNNQKNTINSGIQLNKDEKKKKQTTCKICNKYLSSSGALENHRKTYHPELKREDIVAEPASKNGRPVGSKSVIKSNKSRTCYNQQIYDEKKRNQTTCKLCNKYLSSSGALENHRKTFHPGQKREDIVLEPAQKNGRPKGTKKIIKYKSE